MTMNRWILIGVLAVLGLIAGWSAPQSSREDKASCHRECEIEYKACVEYCGAHRNPIECETDCRDARTDCSRSCE